MLLKGWAFGLVSKAQLVVYAAAVVLRFHSS
jgi:hypothetical protein